MDCTIYVAKTKALVNREADLRLCFRTCIKPVFSRRGLNINPNDLFWNTLNI